MTRNIKCKKLKENALLPTYGTAYSAGADLYACLEQEVVIEPGQTLLIPTGISMEIPTGYAGLIYARSGLSTKKGLAPANKVGVIDSDYRGEIKVPLYNQSRESQTIEPGERIAQLVVTPFLTAVFEEIDVLEETQRGEGGFGSTGTK